MADDSGDKKHPATERRRQQAREEGQIPRSTDLTSALLLLIALGLLRYFGPDIIRQLASYLADSLSVTRPEPFASNDAVNLLLRAGSLLAMALLPMFAVFAVAAIAANIAQTGFQYSPERAMPDIGNLNPMKGLQRIVSLPNVAKLGFGILKLVIVSTVAYKALQHWTSGVLTAPNLSAMQVAQLLIESTMDTCFWIAGALFILALLDYGFQRWKFEQDIMMSDQELRDELKETEGDPQIAARRKQIHRQLAMQKLRKEVPKADVVVTNPTELAIAIRYDPKTMPAPMVVAKGAGLVAQMIRRLALENGVPVVERKPLAQALYKAVDVGEVIPLDQYNAVAEVLRYVYQMQGKPVPRAA